MFLEYFLCLLFPVFSFAWSYNTSQPTWITSPYFRAGNQAVINTLTGNSTTPTYTFTFSSALNGVPNLAYGIKNYRGNDTLLNQCFQIQRVSLNATNFKVSIQIHGYTNLWILTVPYIAIDPGFPHHLNSFDNVPLNYSSGPLSNFSTQHNTQISHTEYINYTNQASSCNYKVFQLPLTSNKIVIYMTSLYIFASGTSGGGSSNKYPLNLTIDYSIVNTSHYKWTAFFGINATITSLRFSQIIYNQDDVQNSKKYSIVYDFWVVNSSAQWQAFPQQLIDNMIIGLQDFQTIDGACGFQYQWEYANSSSVFGVEHLASVPKVAYCGFSVARSNVFYIKTWQCSSPYIYFNLTDSLCQDACGDYYIQNTTAKVCDHCYYTCQQCTLANSPQNCTFCDISLNRILINGICECDLGYYDDGYEATCRSCSIVISHCDTCSYSLNSSQPASYYQTIFSSTTWSTDILSNFTCLSCTSPYFLNSSHYCELCTLSNCLSCYNSTTCQTCNSSANATLSVSKTCIICNINNCITCSSTNFCSVCDASYNVINGSCYLCNQSCTCNGWILPLVNGTCSTSCGDGIIQGAQQCDDGNTLSNDGCSSVCLIQYCGDGIIQGIQQCDDGNALSNDGCSSVCLIQYCGDGIAQTYQECDNNSVNGNQCSSNCTIIYLHEATIFIPSIYSQYVGYGFFILGFKIVGMQMLSVIQNFQLILNSTKSTNFQMDFSSHGYINEKQFFFKIQSATHLLTYFNFMFVAILFVFFVGIFLQWISLCSSKYERKIANSCQNLNEKNQEKNQAQNSDTSNENSSQVSQDFVVHCKKKPKSINLVQNQDNFLKISDNSSQLQQKSSSNILHKLANIILKQILMNLIINQLYVFAYGISLEFNSTQFQYFLNLPTILIFSIYLLAFIVIFWYLYSKDVSFGQNQLKFKKGFWINYWLTVTAERLIIGTILGGQYTIGLYIVLAVKVLFIFYFMLMKFYETKSQFRRSIVTHVLHLILISVYILDIEYFQKSSFKQNLPLHIMQYIQIAILLLVVLIALGYLFKQAVYKCEADCQQQEQKELSQMQKMQKMSQDSLNSLKVTNQIFQKRKNTFQKYDDFHLNFSEINTKNNQSIQEKRSHIKKTFQKHEKQNPKQEKKERKFQRSQQKEQQDFNNTSYKSSNSHIILQSQLQKPQSSKIRKQQQVMNDQYKQYVNRNNNLRQRRKGQEYNIDLKHNQSEFNYQEREMPLKDKTNRLKKYQSHQNSHYSHKIQRSSNLSNIYARHLISKKEKRKKSMMNIINTYRSDQSQQFDDKISIYQQ